MFRRMATAQAEAAELAAECARADNHELGREVCTVIFCTPYIIDLISIV